MRRDREVNALGQFAISHAVVVNACYDTEECTAPLPAGWDFRGWQLAQRPVCKSSRSQPLQGRHDPLWSFAVLNPPITSLARIP